MHRTWRESLKPSEKRHPEAQDLTPEKVKMLSLQFMAVASATGLTKLISPQRLIVDEMEATARTLAQDVELKRTQLPSDDSPARKAALADLEKAQELLARKQDDVTHYKEASWRRGFYAITSDSGMIELRQHIASSRLLGLPREESVRPANAHALTQG